MLQNRLRAMLLSGFTRTWEALERGFVRVGLLRSRALAAGVSGDIETPAPSPYDPDHLTEDQIIEELAAVTWLMVVVRASGETQELERLLNHLQHYFQSCPVVPRINVVAHRIGAGFGIHLETDITVYAAEPTMIQ